MEKEHNKKKGTLWQIIMFYLVSGIVTIVDLAVFSLCSYLVFKGFQDIGVQWWLLDYTVENGGLCALLSLAVSFAVSQSVNFLLQRKVTFTATSNVVFSAIMYAIMVIGIYFLIIWLPTLYYADFVSWFGATWGPILVKISTQLISCLIQFPMNKWVIMRSDKNENP